MFKFKDSEQKLPPSASAWNSTNAELTGYGMGPSSSGAGEAVLLLGMDALAMSN